MQITKNLKRKEFDCSCGCGFDVVDVELAPLIQSACDYFKLLYNADEVYVTITGGNRCTEHNASIGGAPKSQHIFGKAADHNIRIKLQGEIIQISTNELAAFYETAHPDRLGIGLYPNGRVHVDVRDTKARWDAR